MNPLQVNSERAILVIVRDPEERISWFNTLTDIKGLPTYTGADS